MPLQGKPKNIRELLGIHTNVVTIIHWVRRVTPAQKEPLLPPELKHISFPAGVPHPHNLGTHFLKPDSGQENGLQVWVGPALPQLPSTWEHLQDRPRVPSWLWWPSKASTEHGPPEPPAAPNRLSQTFRQPWLPENSGFRASCAQTAVTELNPLHYQRVTIRVPFTTEIL